MKPPIDVNPETLLNPARAGDEQAQGRVLELHRNYLRLLARSLVGQALRTQFDPSDLVQETFLEAHRDFPPVRRARQARAGGPPGQHPGIVT